MRIFCVLAALLASSTATAGTPRLVRDINPTIIPVDGNPSELIDQGSWSLFQATDGVHHGGPWATDGTLAGTVDLGSVTPFDHGQSGSQTVRAGGYTYMFSSGMQLQPILYRMDGTAAGTRIVKDFSGISDSGYVVGTIGNDVLFSLWVIGKGREYWRSDGTAAGTVAITGAQGGSATGLFIANGKLYFLAIDFDTSLIEPWVSDGTAAGTHRISQIPDASPIVATAEINRVGNYLVFPAATTTSGGELWRIDLANDSLSLLKDIAPGDANGVTDGRIASLGNVAVFTAATTEGGVQTLWRTDGTPAGTYQVSGAITPMSDAPTFREASTAHRMLFRVHIGGDVIQLWSTDGTTATQLAPPGPSFLDTVGGNVYFYSGPNSAVWRSDGTPTGTKQLTGLPANPGNVSFAGSDTKLFVRTTGPSTIPMSATIYQWSYDLAADSAVLLRSHPLPAGAQWPSLFGYAQGRLYFDSVDAVTGREIYSSDGTPAGTRLVRNIAPESRTQPSDPRDFFEYKDQLYFTADDGVTGRELWRSDGTTGGTQLFADLNPGSNSSNPISFFVLAGKLHFFARDTGTSGAYKLFTTDGVLTPAPVMAATPRELLWSGQPPCGDTVAEIGGFAYLSLYEQGFTTSLWRTDGTAGGTTRFQDLTNTIDDPCWLTVFRDKIFFSGRQFNTVGTELFSAVPGSIPTLAADVMPGNQGSQPEELTVFNNRLYFRATTSGGFKIYSTDGVAPGATLLDAAVNFPNNLRVANGKLFFLQSSPGVASVGLFAGDGTTAGTARVGTVGVGGPLYSNGARVFFAAVGSGVPFNTTEPWVSDGTTAGTSTLAFGGFPAARQVLFWDFNGATIIQAAQGNGEAQLWRTDGTLAGTRLLGDAGVVAQNHYPVKHMAAGQTFYFVSDKNGSGTELFAVDNERPVAANDAAGSVAAGVGLAINVTGNDTDADGSVRAATVIAETQPAHGFVSVSNTGVVTYTALASYTGADSFTYTVADDQGARSATATVTVTVTAPPVSGGGSGGASGGGAGGGGGGGGGAFGLLELLYLGALLTMLGIRRRA